MSHRFLPFAPINNKTYVYENVSGKNGRKEDELVCKGSSEYRFYKSLGGELIIAATHADAQRKYMRRFPDDRMPRLFEV